MDSNFNITEYIRDGYVILIPVLYIIGSFIKHSERINNKYIPLILMGVGIVFGICISLGCNDTVLSAIINGTVQGILTAGAAVLSDQVVKQLSKKDDQ